MELESENYEALMLHLLMYARLYLKKPSRVTVNVLKGTIGAKAGTLRVLSVGTVLTQCTYVFDIHTLIK